MRVQAEGAFDNINKKPDAKDKVLSEGAPHAPPPHDAIESPAWRPAVRLLEVLSSSSGIFDREEGV
jgi:hypothetical protein